MSENDTLVCPAPAKLNLFLHVVGQRADGYHLLQTVFRFLDFSDELEFVSRRRCRIRLCTPLPGVPEEKDLCVRAARLLQRESGTSLGVDIFLKKRIPMGGGLGGGSSDAATTLLALNRLWALGWKRKRLLKLGLGLGADVPVFIFGENAFAEGVGEELRAIDLPSAWYLVLTPPVHVSTAEVFGSKELTRNTIPIKIPPFSVEHGHNDLEPVVCRIYPEVARSCNGSGSSTAPYCGNDRFRCLRICGVRHRAAARSALTQVPPGMNGFVAQGLDRHPLHDFAEE